MPEPFVSSPVLQHKAVSPLQGHMAPAKSPSTGGTISVSLSERSGLSICEVAAWPETAQKVKAELPDAAQNFEFAPARWLVMSTDAHKPWTLAKEIGEDGSVVDLSHGRTVMRVSGAESIWMLAKLFAIDFAKMATQTGIATAHHGISAQIWREDDDTFDIIVFRSFARSFWETLKRSCGDVGYEVL